MAQLKAPAGGTGLQIEQLAPVGQAVAVCLRINDQFGVERPKFNSPQEKELKDVTRFVFGLIGQDGRPYLAQTFEFTISGAPGSNLMDFLKNWLGRPAEMGWDYCAMLGKGALITIAHTPSRKKPGVVYADITNIAAVPAQMNSYVPAPATFEAMLQALEAKANAGTPPAAGNGTPPALPPRTPPAYQPPVSAPPPPPAAPAFTPPPPPPVADTRKFYVHVNGATQEVVAAQLPTFPPTAPAMAVGEQTWKTVADYLPKFPAAPGAPATATLDEDVPF